MGLFYTIVFIVVGLIVNPDSFLFASTAPGSHDLTLVYLLGCGGVVFSAWVNIKNL